MFCVAALSNGTGGVAGAEVAGWQRWRPSPGAAADL